MPVPPPLRAGTGWLFLQAIDGNDKHEIFRSPSLANPSQSLAIAFADLQPGTMALAMMGDKILRGTCVATSQRTSDRSASAPRGYVAVDATATMTELRRLAVTLAGVWVTASALALASAWWLRRSVIGPIERLGAGIRAIDPEHPETRLHEDAPVEMVATIRLLNDLLDRQAKAMEREKGTIANIAHELRSPISGLRTTLEVAALEEKTDSSTLARRCLPTVTGMHTMVANLLSLARLEAGREQVDLCPTNLDELVTLCLSTLEPIVLERSHRIELHGAGGMVRTGPDQARMVISNLIQNAITHSPTEATVTMTLHVSGALAWLRISNPIAGPPPDPQRIFEPFWRIDTARTSQEHCGLGLALVRRLAALLGAELAIEVADQRFTIHFGLPVAG